MSATLPLFVYGTLMDKNIIESILGKNVDLTDVTLLEFQRYALIGRVYPGIVSQKDARVFGKLVSQLDQQDIDHLDEFEGDEYRRERVWVVNPSGERLQVWAYVLSAQYQSLITRETWNFEKFQDSSSSEWKKSIEQSIAKGQNAQHP